MSLINYFRRKKSANIAKDRLQIIIAQERSETTTTDFLPMLRKEILDVVAKYAKIDVNKVNVDLHRKDNSSILELNVMLPENLQEKSAS
jgi:cell division topological specificity factor